MAVFEPGLDVWHEQSGQGDVPCARAEDHAQVGINATSGMNAA